MGELLVLLITVAILAIQFHFGIRKRKLLGAIIPTIMVLLFILITCMEKTTEYVLTGLLCVAAILITWVMGYLKSAKYEKSALDKMKAKDIQ